MERPEGKIDELLEPVDDRNAVLSAGIPGWRGSRASRAGRK